MSIKDKQVKKGDFTQLIKDLKKEYAVHYKYQRDNSSIVCKVFSGFDTSTIIFVCVEGIPYLDCIETQDTNIESIITKYFSIQPVSTTSVYDEIDNQLGILSFAIMRKDDKLEARANKELRYLHSLIHT